MPPVPVAGRREHGDRQLADRRVAELARTLQARDVCRRIGGRIRRIPVRAAVRAGVPGEQVYFQFLDPHAPRPEVDVAGPDEPVRRLAETGHEGQMVLAEGGAMGFERLRSRRALGERPLRPLRIDVRVVGLRGELLDQQLGRTGLGERLEPGAGRLARIEVADRALVRREGHACEGGVRGKRLAGRQSFLDEVRLELDVDPDGLVVAAALSLNRPALPHKRGRLPHGQHQDRWNQRPECALQPPYTSTADCP